MFHLLLNIPFASSHPIYEKYFLMYYYNLYSKKS